jgi:hypothetical protein
MIKLGDKVTDNLTGFTGVAIARCEYLNGCIRYEIQSLTLEKGQMAETIWIDEERISLILKKLKTGGSHKRPPEIHP